MSRRGIFTHGQKWPITPNIAPHIHILTGNPHSIHFDAWAKELTAEITRDNATAPAIIKATVSSSSLLR